VVVPPVCQGLRCTTSVSTSHPQPPSGTPPKPGVLRVEFSFSCIVRSRAADLWVSEEVGWGRQAEVDDAQSIHMGSWHTAYVSFSHPQLSQAVPPFQMPR
jgi:hypothetical protein